MRTGQDSPPSLLSRDRDKAAPKTKKPHCFQYDLNFCGPDGTRPRLYSVETVTRQFPKKQKSHIVSDVTLTLADRTGLE
ncbi:hypothetical protein SAMN05660909_05279, partial [Chitinophaga terrae (ex Kim and Jung 2007)]